VLQHELEGAFVCGPVNHPDLAEDTVFAERLVLLSAPGERDLPALLGRSGLRIVVLKAGCSYRQKLETLLALRGIVGLRLLEFGTLEAIIASVAAGLGVTLLPKNLIGQVWKEGRVAIHELPEPETQVETCFIRRHDGFVSSALSAFLDTSRPLRLAAE
jgi:DNA-binding transcriptional LysR family regulator